jgi:hypothetical protein
MFDETVGVNVDLESFAWLLPRPRKSQEAPERPNGGIEVGDEAVSRFSGQLLCKPDLITVALNVNTIAPQGLYSLGIRRVVSGSRGTRGRRLCDQNQAAGERLRPVRHQAEADDYEGRGDNAAHGC